MPSQKNIFDEVRLRFTQERPFRIDNLKSSNVLSLEYDPRNQSLRVYFLSGRIYEYYRVPKGKVVDFIRARSKGEFVWRKLHGIHSYERVR